jgi:tRNA threonylcarbamoyladenosine biosynthesis protein TsaB
MILGIDTATENCSIALFNENGILGTQSFAEKNAHSAVLTVMIEELLKSQNLSLSKLKAIAISEGPGSYTGLRIGYSTAKGLCFGLDIPLINVSTLASMAQGLKINSPNYDLYCPMIDARRMEVYTAVFDSNLNNVVSDTPMILNEKSLQDIFKNKKVLVGGNGSNKFKDWFVQNDNIYFVENLDSKAEFLVNLALEKFNNNDFADLVYSEPNYIKAFYTTMKLSE